MSKKILVTGACGYVGTVLTETLLSKGYSVIGVDTMWFGNYLKPNSNLELIQSSILEIEKINMKDVSTIIHLANIANDPTGDLNSKLTWEVNVLASQLLIEKAIQNKVEQFIYASSGSVYGVKSEDHVTEDLSLVPISDYNKTKMVSERVLLSYKDRIRLQIIRPATVCGLSPRMRLDLSVNMLSMQAIKNKKITVFGGNQTRPNIHIQDMIRVYLHFLESAQSHEGIFNAGFENISILDIAERAAKRTEAKIEVSESNDPRSYRLNSDKLLNTGFEQKYKVDDAIGEILTAYQSGSLKDEENSYNVKTMLKLNLQK